MDFMSLQFLFVFLPITTILYYIVGKKGGGGKNIYVLLISSALFIFLLDKYTLLFLVVSIVATYAMSTLVVKVKKSRRLLLVISIFFTLFPLLVCKYLHFFTSQILRLHNDSIICVFVPIGISFFTFRQIMYLVDGYRDGFRLPFEKYVIYIIFFPCITSGPIDIPHDFDAQCDLNKSILPNWDDIADGVVRLIIGYSKKLLIADSLAKLVDVCYQEYTESSTMAIVAMVAYTLQIYYDFSGYTDMAIGISNILGFHPMENFDSPYQSRTVGEFWKKWHISLTNFFSKYVYIPLGGNRCGKPRTYFNILIIFFLSGLWHGADWSFIIWGVAYGLILVAERIFKIKQDSINPLLGRVITFLIINVLWVFFRADNVNVAVSLFRQMAANCFIPLSEAAQNSVITPEIEFLVMKLHFSESLYVIWPYIFLAIAFLITQIRVNSRQICEQKLYRTKWGVVMLSVAALLSTLSFSETSGFIYWNF